MMNQMSIKMTQKIELLEQKLGKQTKKELIKIQDSIDELSDKQDVKIHK